jgi:uncharacterized membrane protein required for colicin V production
VSNWLDYLLILLMVLGLTIGYVQGLLRQVVNLAAMYLGAILAAQYFHLLGTFLKAQLVTTPGTLLNAVSFFIIMFAVTVLLNFLTFDAYKNTKLTLFPVLDHLGGMLLGFVATWILITLAINVLTFATSAQSWSSAEEVRQVLKNGILGSVIAAATGTTLPTILGTIKPWLPAGLPTIFNL